MTDFRSFTDDALFDRRDAIAAQARAGGSEAFELSSLDDEIRRRFGGALEPSFLALTHRANRDLRDLEAEEAARPVEPMPEDTFPHYGDPDHDRAYAPRRRRFVTVDRTWR